MKSCDRQLRASFSGPAGLDFGAIFAFAAAIGAPPSFLADILPEIERVILWAHHKEESQ